MRFGLGMAAGLLLLSACGELKQVGKAPAFTPETQTGEVFAMQEAAMDKGVRPNGPETIASLWQRGPRSLLGDRRAGTTGDILTVLIEIDDKAEISNSTQRSRAAAQNMGVPQLLGIPQRLDGALPAGASMANAVELNSSGSSSGDGSVSRNEKLTLKVAATVLEVMPNGALRISGQQEVRVNYELRELYVTGIVRPEDISRRNTITYDKIASARISYGGRGQISQVQQPRKGQQVVDILLPF